MIVGLHTAYRVNDLVNVTCFFGPLKGTSMSLSWYINGTKVGPLPLDPYTTPRSGLGGPNRAAIQVSNKLLLKLLSASIL